MKRAQFPPELAEFFSAYNLHDAQLVTTSDERERLDVWVSYIPQLRCFCAHQKAIGEVRANSLGELAAKIAETLPEAEIHLHLSKRR
jgi:hypothetical protein